MGDFDRAGRAVRARDQEPSLDEPLQDRPHRQRHVIPGCDSSNPLFVLRETYQPQERSAQRVGVGVGHVAAADDLVRGPCEGALQAPQVISILDEVEGAVGRAVFVQLPEREREERQCITAAGIGSDRLDQACLQLDPGHACRAFDDGCDIRVRHRSDWQGLALQIEQRSTVLEGAEEVSPKRRQHDERRAGQLQRRSQKRQERSRFVVRRQTKQLLELVDNDQHTRI